MKAFRQLILPALFILMASILPAEETKPETAWDEDTEIITGGSTYAYGWITVPQDFLHRLQAGSDENPDADPFGGGGTSQKKTFPNIQQRFPANQLPLCLPKGLIYYDASKILNQNGLNIKAPQWAFYTSKLNGHSKLYFCTTWMNSDIINALFMAIHCPGPRSIALRTNVVSIENQGLENIAWTSDKLDSLHPTTHTSYGLSGRSGEKASLMLKSESPAAYGISEYETTIGENNRFFDCRLHFHFKLTGKTGVKINHNTAITGEIGTPFIIDCGTHGIDQRNYLLVIHSTFKSHDSHPFEYYEILKRLDKIEGIYALRKDQPINKTQAKLETLRYQVDATFLDQLRFASDNDGSAKVTIPALIKDIPIAFNHQKNDRIFDITALLKLIGTGIIEHNKQQRIFYNESQHQLIIHGSPDTQESVLGLYSAIRSNIRMVRTNARIVSVDIKDLETPTWSIEEIEKRQPKQLAKYSVTGRSGEKSTSGKIMKKRILKNKKTGKEETQHHYKFEIESTIGDRNAIIDTRIIINSPPLGAQKTTIELNTALTLFDGTPTILELGHPTSRTRTHLLILNADLIRPNGTFYRNLLKPIK